MTAGHILSHNALGRKVNADFDRKHRKWPLGMFVLVKTPAGYIRGRVFKHWRKDENEHGCSVEFPFVVDMGDANGSRFCHEIPFRSLKPVVATLPDALYDKLLSLTELNLHVESYLAAARAFGLPKLEAQFERIIRDQARFGYMPPKLYAEKREAYEKLMSEAKLRLSDDEYKALYMCF
jgi:hypothetical protein